MMRSFSGNSMHFASFRHLILSAASAMLLLAGGGIPAVAQSSHDFPEYYRQFSFDANEQIRFCFPLDSASADFESVGVRRDSAGRPVMITRFRFGNADTRSDWATMRIEYRSNPAAGTLLVRRTYFSPNGMPIDLATLGNVIHAEEVLYKRGALALRSLLDTAGKLVNDTASVSRSIFRAGPDGMMQQEFFYGGGKQQYGGDLPWRQFAPLPAKGAYFRLYRADTAGNLLREEIRDFTKKPIPFPGGEYVRIYHRDGCGFPLRVDFADLQGHPMVNRDGIAYETTLYDQHGRMVEWRAFNAAGLPKGRSSDGAARIERRFREFDGVFVEERKFDTGDHLLPADEH